MALSFEYDLNFLVFFLILTLHSQQSHFVKINNNICINIDSYTIIINNVS